MWLAPFLLYGAAFVAQSLRAPLAARTRVALLAVQTGSVLPLPWLGLGGFEGLLLAIVVAEAPTVLSFRHSVIWAIAQAPPLFATVFPLKSALELSEILGAYSSFSLFALLLYHLHLQERRARTELAEAHAALISTQALVIEGSRQGERLRISRELHDSLGHHLAALSVQLELAQQLATGAVVAPVASARNLSRESLAEIRRVVSVIRTAPKMDLIAAVRALSASIPAPRILVEGQSDGILEDPETAHALFRCVQEAITNSIKHAGADNVWVTLRPEGEKLHVNIRDDGLGAAAFAPGNGLEGMRARAGRLGGRAEFESYPGRGFEVRISVPRSAG
jgi:signal transduction histidine kinase